MRRIERGGEISIRPLAFRPPRFKIGFRFPEDFSKGKGVFLKPSGGKFIR